MFRKFPNNFLGLPEKMKSYLLNFKRLLFFLVVLAMGACSQKKQPFANLQFDILIKNGKILDGSGEQSYEADILIHRDTIAYIGKVDAKEITVTQVIDAKGKVVTPGFIDAHAHGDPFETGEFKNFLAMGVTTICLGQDGNSPMEAMDSWLTKLEQEQLGVNIAMFVGHGTLRKLAGINFKKNPTATQLKQQQKILQEALDQGLFGMTTGLEYTPGIFATDEELLPLAKIIGNKNGLIMSHVRNEDDNQLEKSIQELLRQGQHCKVQVSHMKSVYGKGANRGKELLTLLESNGNTNYTVTADAYPYNASYTGIGIVFPAWAKPPHDYKEVVKTRRSELLAFLKQKIIARNGPEATLFGTMPYAGKTLAQLSQEQNLPYEQILLGMGPNRASGAYFIMDDALQETILAHPSVMVSSDGSPTMRHPRGYGTFAKIIEEYVRKRKTFSLAEAVRKMTSLPAATIGIQKRGLLKVGYYGDLLIFDPARIKANATYEYPHQLASGFDWILLNGEVVWKEGKLMERKGQVLRKQLIAD